MMDRLSGLFDRSVDASLRAVGSDDLSDQLAKYLADAHAIEEQATELLERGQEAVGDRELARTFETHLAETRRHAELIENRLDALGGDPSLLEDALMRMGGLNWSAFFPGTSRHARQARRLRLRLRAPGNRRLRAAAPGGRARRRRVDDQDLVGDPRRRACRGCEARRRIRPGGRRVPRGRRRDGPRVARWWPTRAGVTSRRSRRREPAVRPSRRVRAGPRVRPVRDGVALRNPAPPSSSGGGESGGGVYAGLLLTRTGHGLTELLRAASSNRNGHLR
jgi:Domain of unknown function (DUF892)